MLCGIYLTIVVLIVPFSPRFQLSTYLHDNVAHNDNKYPLMITHTPLYYYKPVYDVLTTCKSHKSVLKNSF